MMELDIGGIVSSGGVGLAAVAIVADRIVAHVYRKNGKHPTARLARSVDRQAAAAERMTESLDRHERESAQRWRDGAEGLTGIRETLGEIKGGMK